MIFNERRRIEMCRFSELNAETESQQLTTERKVTIPSADSKHIEHISIFCERVVQNHHVSKPHVSLLKDACRFLYVLASYDKKGYWSTMTLKKNTIEGIFLTTK